jgi:hypothetical protein
MLGSGLAAPIVLRQPNSGFVTLHYGAHKIVLVSLRKARPLAAAPAHSGVKTMLKRIFWTMILTLSIFAIAQPANATLVDRFLVEYDSTFSVDFTGTVEPDGSIQLADLSDVSFTSLFFRGVTLPKADVSLFSFNTTGGASSLDFIVSDPAVPVLACGGASIALFAPCNNFGRVPTDATLMIFTAAPAWSTDLPTITLLSSTAVPEPATWTMLLAGFVGLGLVGALSRGRGARQAG